MNHELHLMYGKEHSFGKAENAVICFLKLGERLQKTVTWKNIKYLKKYTHSPTHAHTDTVFAFGFFFNWAGRG